MAFVTAVSLATTYLLLFALKATLPITMLLLGVIVYLLCANVYLATHRPEARTNKWLGGNAGMAPEPS